MDLTENLNILVKNCQKQSDDRLDSFIDFRFFVQVQKKILHKYVRFFPPKLARRIKEKIKMGDVFLFRAHMQHRDSLINFREFICEIWCYFEVDDEIIIPTQLSTGETNVLKRAEVQRKIGEHDFLRITRLLAISPYDTRRRLFKALLRVNDAEFANYLRGALNNIAQ